MRPPNSILSLLCRGVALATLTLSTLPISAQGHIPPHNGGFSLPNPFVINPKASWARHRNAAKYWRSIHGDRNRKLNPANVARAFAKIAHMKPLTSAAMHGKSGGGGPHYLGQGISTGIGNGTATNDGNGVVGPYPPTPTGDMGWEYVGPNNLGNGGPGLYNTGIQLYTGPDVTSGRVNGAAFDPENPSTIFIATAAGGIWKTTDGGTTWTPLTDHTPGVIGETFSSVAVSPTNSNIVFAGSGDYDTGIPGYGLFRSTDGGATWHLTSLPTNNNAIRKILFDPNNSKHIIVALGLSTDEFGLYESDGGSIYQTLDGGNTWVDVQDFPGAPGAGSPPQGWVSDIVYNLNGTVLYASVDNAGIYQSLDNGTTWNLTPGALVSTARLDVATSQTDPNTVYVLSAADEAIYKSTNAGSSWFDTTNNFNTSFGYGNFPYGDRWYQSGYDFYLTVAPGIIAGVSSGEGPAQNPTGPPATDIVYVGLVGISQSTDGGNSWNDVTNTWSGTDLIHTDQHGLVVNPANPNQALSLNDGGIYLTTYDPYAGSFTTKGLNSTLGTFELYSSAVHPIDGTNAMACMQDNSVGHADFNLSVWDIITTGDGTAAAYTVTAPEIQYGAIYQGILFQSDNDWNADVFSNSEQYIGVPDPGVNFVTPLAMGANSRWLISAGMTLDTYDHGPTVYPSVAGTWRTKPPLLQTKANPADVADCVGASPTNEFIFFAGMDSGSVFYSADQGVTVNEFDGVASNSSSPLPPLPVTGITGGFANINRVYVTLGLNTNSSTPHIWRCDNMTAQTPIWTPIDGSGGPSQLPEVSINSLAILPHSDEQSIVVGTDIGVFMTVDGGNTWSPINTIPGTTGTLPQVVVNKVTFNASTGTIDAATYGRGIWRAKIGSDTPFQIDALMTGYKGNRSKLQARVDLFPSGLVDYSPAADFEEVGAIGYPARTDGIGTPEPYKYFLTPTEIRFGNLTPAGIFTANISSRGIYDALITVPRFLRKRVKQINTALVPLSTARLKLGDCAGPIDLVTGLFGPPDNVIDLNDLDAIAQYLTLVQEGLVSQYNSGPLDVNGDGIVDVRDYNIILAALIASGGNPILGD